jgi:hypothetical protein
LEQCGRIRVAIDARLQGGDQRLLVGLLAAPAVRIITNSTTISTRWATVENRCEDSQFRGDACLAQNRTTSVRITGAFSHGVAE